MNSTLYDGMEPLERLRNVITLINKVIDQVRKQVLQDGFTAPADEIYFFKRIKPRLYALRQYEILLYNLQANAPAGPAEYLRQYYEQELLVVFREMKTSAFHSIF